MVWNWNNNYLRFLIYLKDRIKLAVWLIIIESWEYCQFKSPIDNEKPTDARSQWFTGSWKFWKPVSIFSCTLYVSSFPWLESIVFDSSYTFASCWNTVRHKNMIPIALTILPYSLWTTARNMFITATFSTVNSNLESKGNQSINPREITL